MAVDFKLKDSVKGLYVLDLVLSVPGDLADGLEADINGEALKYGRFEGVYEKYTDVMKRMQDTLLSRGFAYLDKKSNLVLKRKLDAEVINIDYVV